MAGFRKATAEQAFIKMALYGAPGSGKTFTSLLVAEGLAKHAGKRVAFIDTERGTDFYVQPVAERAAHPEAFDFDALYTRSITDTLDAIRSIDLNTYGVVVLDSISHIWDACIAAYKGKTTKIGTIPINAWGEIKKPYKELMALLLGIPAHVVICGRQGNEMAENADGELTKVGVKLRAEGETQYEPHILVRMEAPKPKRPGDPLTVMAFVEKDRTGKLQGKTLPSPTFDTLIKPIIPLLGSSQAKVETEDETAQRDADAMSAADAKRAEASAKTLTIKKAEMQAASVNGKEAVKKVAATITAEMKKQMLPQHVAELREEFVRLTGGAAEASN